MIPVNRLSIALFAGVAFATSSASAQHVREGAWVYEVTLTGAAEVPGPGDMDASGSVTLFINPGQKRVCFEFEDIAGMTAPTAAHIHEGSTTEAGPVRVDLGVPTLGDSQGCMPATSRQLAQIIAKPQNYYVNVHTLPTFGAGAIRGQLSRPNR